MIVKSKGGGCQVVSKAGKPLSKPNMTLKQCKERLAQVERFSRKKK